MPEPKPKSTRDLRLDALRGLCLVMIFINHVPGTVFESLTSRNFGFSDSAEAFVMISGIAAGLAYSTAFRAGFGWQAVGRVWRRAWTIYLVQSMLVGVALAILAWGATYLGAGDLLALHDFGAFATHPLEVHIGLPLLSYQISYVDILPLYIVLLLAAPAMLWAGLRWPLLVWAASGSLWAVAGFWRLNLHDFPLAGEWYFNPLIWQVVFCTGLLTGSLMKSGRRLVPVRRWVQGLCLLYLAAALICARSLTVSQGLGGWLWAIQEAGVPPMFTTFDKTWLTAPRLLHILALTYLLSSLPWVARASASRAAAPLVLMGRHALPIFAAGSMMALAAQVVKTAYPASQLLDTALVLGGLGVQLGFALALDRGRLTQTRTAGFAG